MGVDIIDSCQYVCDEVPVTTRANMRSHRLVISEFPSMVTSSSLPHEDIRYRIIFEFPNKILNRIEYLKQKQFKMF